MKRFVLITCVLAVTIASLAATLSAVTTQTIEVTAKKKDGGVVEKSFTVAPTGNKDEIHVRNKDATGKDAGVYNDPLNDGALLDIIEDSKNPVKVDVEGREGIGAIYWVTVFPGSGGGATGGATGRKDALWADVQDLVTTDILILQDSNSGLAVADRDTTSAPSVLFCQVQSDGKADVKFRQLNGTGSYTWTITPGNHDGTLTGPGYNDTQINLDPSTTEYLLTVKKSGVAAAKRELVIDVHFLPGNLERPYHGPHRTQIVEPGPQGSSLPLDRKRGNLGLPLAELSQHRPVVFE